MSNVITAVVTEDALLYWPQMLANLATFETVLTFKIGEGGWIDQGAGREPRTPDPALRRLDNDIQDLDAIVDSTRIPADQRYASDERFTFEKTLTASDLTFVPPSSLRCRCFLDLAEANDDGFGNDPEFYEIGIFTDHPDFPGTESLMIAYGTFAQEIKDSSRQIENIFLLTWGNV